MATNSTNNRHPRGSEWRKWDLHVHTPGTKQYDNYRVDNSEDVWDVFCKNLEESDVAVFGITDYFSVDNYLNLVDKFNKKYPNSEKVFFPNIEFRINSKNKDGDFIQIHVIFSDDTEVVNNIPDFLGRLPLISTDDEDLTNKYCKEDDLDEIGFGKAIVTLEKLKEHLDNDFSNDQYIVCGLARGYGSLRPESGDGRGDEYAKEVDKKCQIFFGSSDDVDFFLNDVDGRSQYNLPPKAVLSGCDSHSFDDLENKLGKNYVKKNENDEVCDRSEIIWIKTDLTFEGLRQILYEPRHRVHIGENEPRKPTHFIESFTLDVPDGARIEVSEEKQDEFIFAGNNNEYELNPYFNCFVGGRGVGKSTLLSLLGLHSSNKESAKKFWGREIKPYNESFDPESILEVNGSNDFEYIGQGAVNKIASDTKRLTGYIYSRIRQREGVNFENKETKLSGLLQDIEQDIDRFEQRIDIEKTIEELKERKSTLEKVVSLEEDEEVIEKKEKLKNKIAERSKLTNGKSDFFILKSQLIDLVNQHTDENDPDEAEEANEKSYYEQQIETIISSLEDVLEKIDEDEVEEKKDKEETLSQDIETLEEEYEALLKKKGISQEDIKERSEAPGKIAEINRQLKTEKRKCDQIIEKILDDYKTELEKAADEYEKVIEFSIESIKAKLSSEKTEESSLAELAIRYSQDEERAWNELSIAFYQHYEHLRDGRSLEDNVRRLLVDDLKKLLAGDVELEEIRKKLENNETESGLFLKECFNQPFATEIFQRIRDKHLYDKNRYKQLSITYDEDPIEKRSFGERSTTVLIVFLLFGNKPIIIDEPEAHLDSRLIADYLVDLIKRVKIDRQIIFATHNANFVINGDAEQIYILEVDNKRTRFTQTSIENLSHRKNLLSLEGGEDAFDKRRQKYNF